MQESNDHKPGDGGPRLHLSNGNGKEGREEGEKEEELDIQLKKAHQKMETHRQFLLQQVEQFMKKQDELVTQLLTVHQQHVEKTLTVQEASPVQPRTLQRCELPSGTAEESGAGPAAKPPGNRPKLKSGKAAMFQSTYLMHCLARILFSKAFETISSLVIIANTVYMAYQADHQMKLAISGEEEDQTGSIVFECIFTCYYTLEILLRFVVLQRKFIYSEDVSWNCFDTLLVGTAWYDVGLSLAGGEGGGNLSFLRVMRLMKMLKLLRMIRLMRAFRELRMILNSVMSSVKSMFWAILLIITVAFMFGLCFVQASTAYILEHRPVMSDRELMQLDKFWGGVLTSIYTLYVASMGGCDWIEYAESLSPVGDMYMLLFLMYIGFFFCVVTNTLTSLFVESCMTNADKDQQLVIQAELEQKDNYVKILSGWYHELDEDKSGEVTLDEFMAHVEDDEMILFAVAMDINIMDVKQFFTVLSSNGRRPVDLDNFIVGCIKLKGMAKSMDLLDMSYNQKQAHEDLIHFTHNCDSRFEMLTESVKDLRKAVEQAGPLTRQGELGPEVEIEVLLRHLAEIKESKLAGGNLMF